MKTNVRKRGNNIMRILRAGLFERVSTEEQAKYGVVGIEIKLVKE